MHRTIVIVGAGFCGSVLAANMLRRPPPGRTDLILIERGTSMGRGVAYASHEVSYILNVPAGRLSVHPDDPLHFLRFVRQSHPDADAEDFMPRSLYGEYLQAVLDEAERAAPKGIALRRVFGEVTGIERVEGEQPLRVQVAGRAPVAADRVVLALGNPPSAVHPWARGLLHHPAYFHNPWSVPRSFRARHSVLIVGSGLTMVDVALALSLEGGQMPLVRAISRHGLLPLGQTIFRPMAVHGDEESFMANAQSIRRVLAMTRALSARVEKMGGDWREVVTFMRHLAPDLWRRLPQRERRRFLRHVQSYWDVHRHRVPANMAARIDHMRRSGRLRVHAGRIQELVPEGDELRVMWRRRGSDENESFAVHAVINATGPDYALRRSADPLLCSLRAAGLVSEDPLNLGLRTGRYGACIAADGSASAHLFYLGPMLRADHWEATAVPELRAHAEQLARHLSDPAPSCA
ncbi:MAG: FAD/NAD(P)-binding protein [Steroidobacteraceae bacterium]